MADADIDELRVQHDLAKTFLNGFHRRWRIVLARPLLSARLGDWQAEGQKLLAELNIIRSQPRQCGTQSFAATTPLTWSAPLATAAEEHARSMANNNYFDHKDRDGRMPGDRAELAGYSLSLIHI